MNDPLAILYEMVRQAREIPELVLECKGDAGRIGAWVDQYSKRTSMLKAMQEQGPESVQFALESAGPATEEGGFWQYSYLVQFRPREEVDPDEGGVLRMWRALANGRVSSTGNRWIHTCFAARTDPPLTLRAVRRQFTTIGDTPIEVFLGQFVITDREP